MDDGKKMIEVADSLAVMDSRRPSLRSRILSIGLMASMMDPGAARELDELLPQRDNRTPWDRVQLTKVERKGKSFQELQALRIAKQGAPNATGHAPGGVTMFKFLFVLFNHLWVELEAIEAKVAEKAEEDFEAELGKVAAWLEELSAKVKALQAKLAPPPIEAPAPVEAAPAESAQEAKGDAAAAQADPVAASAAE